MSAAMLALDLHGVVGVRLVDALPAEAAVVGAALGGMVRPLARTPDIVVRFVPRLETAGLRYVEVERSGFTEDGFILLAHRRRRVRVRLPMDLDGETWEVVCEHGSGVPFLGALIRLAALRRGYAPVHAAAFEHRRAGVLVAGWAHGGKTSSLLAFAQAGAAFVSDDLVLLRGDGGEMLGIATPLSLAGWQLAQLPAARARVGRGRRMLLGAAERLATRSAGRGGAVLNAVSRRLRVNLPPEAVFGSAIRAGAEPGTVFLSIAHASDEIRVERADPAIVARRLAAAFRADLAGFFDAYLAYRFAFPDRRSELIDTAEERAAALLETALAERDVFVVHHPHPVSLRDLYGAMQPHVRRAPKSADAQFIHPAVSAVA